MLVKSVRLVGMMLLLYTRQELQHHLTNLSVDTVGTGIMGKLGDSVQHQALARPSYICIQVTKAEWE